MESEFCIVDTSTRAGAPLVVLLHGFMGFPEDLAPFARSLGVEARFVFPRGPVDLARLEKPPAVTRADGKLGFAWWPVDVDTRAAALSKGPRDLSDFVPIGLEDARAHVDALLRDLCAEHEARGGGALVVGGFSQGAMITCDWALRSARPLAGLVQFSGARICQEEWRARMPARRGLRVFMSHGDGDEDLSFAAAEVFREDMRASGWDVTFCPFEGGHEIPLVALRGFKRFLRDVVAVRTPE